MNITYTAPNRAHHYPYAEALYRSNNLHAFVTGFSRFSPRANIEIGDKLRRFDLYQNLYLAALKANLPYFVTGVFNRLSNTYLDKQSYQWAKDSDVFIYYRTQGRETTLRLQKEGRATLCVLEEVNSHVDNCYMLMKQEFEKLGLGKYSDKFPDHQIRLKAYEEANFVLCPSEFVKKSFIDRGFKPEKIIKVNFGFPQIETINHEFSFEKKEVFRILYVGQINYRKGLRYVIEAFKKLKHPNKELIIVGSKTSITGLEKTVIPKGVIFMGVLKGDSLANEYKKASVFVLPSVEEGLALVLGEALAFGVPIIATTNTGAEDIITDDVEGYIIPPFNSDVLENRLQVIADSEQTRERMSEAAFQKVKKLGGWNVAAENLVSELKNCLFERDAKI